MRGSLFLFLFVVLVGFGWAQTDSLTQKTTDTLIKPKKPMVDTLKKAKVDTVKKTTPKKPEKPKIPAQFKVKAAYTMDDKEFTFTGILQRGEISLGDTLEIYNTKGLVGKCRVLEFENADTGEKLSWQRAVKALQITAKTFKCVISEEDYLVTPKTLPYGLKIIPKKPNPELPKPVQDTLKPVEKDSAKKALPKADTPKNP